MKPATHDVVIAKIVNNSFTLNYMDMLKPLLISVEMSTSGGSLIHESM